MRGNEAILLPLSSPSSQRGFELGEPDHSQLVTNDELDRSAMGPGLIFCIIGTINFLTTPLFPLSKFLFLLPHF